MKKFITNLSVFSCILFSLIIFLLFLPPTPRSLTSLLFAKIDKDLLLKNIKSPRIILIGGSNLSYGINGQLIYDSLDLYPINTAIHAAIGLIYMMDNTIEYVKPGDIVILSYEYQHFFNREVFGGNELLRTVLEVSPESIKTLSHNQLFNIFKFIPKYALSKIKPSEYFNMKPRSILYSRSSFNKYGDVFTHYRFAQKLFKPYKKIKGNINSEIICRIQQFKNKVEEKGATFYVTFPCYQATSFENSKCAIIAVENELKQHFVLLGSAERYKMADSLMFDTPYHLTKEGVDFRTKLLIEDLKRRNL